MAKNTTDLIALGEEWFRKAPAIPANGREGLVKITPWVALVFGVLGIITGIGGLGVLTGSAAFGVLHSAGLGILSTLLFLAASVLLLMAYPGTSKRQYRGWTLIFWSEVLVVLSNLVSFDILGAVVGGLIGFYLLYQIKSYYK